MIAVITAGGPIDDAAFSVAVRTEWKALISFGSRRLIDFAIDAARSAGATRVVLVAPEAVTEYCAGRIDAAVPSSDDGRESLTSALRCGSDDAPLLLSTSDLPFVDGESLTDFCREAVALNADVAMPLAEAAQYRAYFHGAPEHCTRLGRIEISNGSVFYFRDGRSALRSLEIARNLFAARKSLWAMARLLSPSLLLRFATGSLDIAHIEAYAQRRFALHAAAISGQSPRLCFDIDSLADYTYACAFANDHTDANGTSAVHTSAAHVPLVHAKD